MILWRVSLYERRRCKPGSDVPGDLSGKRTGRIIFSIYLNNCTLSLEVDFIGFFYILGNIIKNKERG